MYTVPGEALHRDQEPPGSDLLARAMGQAGHLQVVLSLSRTVRLAHLAEEGGGGGLPGLLLGLQVEEGSPGLEVHTVALVARAAGAVGSEDPSVSLS